MPQQLNELSAVMTEGAAHQMRPGPLLFVMAVSLVASLFISYLYVHFHSSRATGSELYRAFPLLGMALTAIFVTIQFSLPISLGLLGALSVVRFRAPVREPEEIAFVMLVIAASVAIASFKLALAGVLFVAALGALFAQSFIFHRRPAPVEGSIVISLLPGSSAADAAAITALLQRRLRKAELARVSQTGQAIVMSYTVEGIAEAALTSLRSDLANAASHTSHDIFLNRPRAL
ncbi:MAG: DUF4956 domain-containing protein [Burkholderiales bacterium]